MEHNRKPINGLPTNLQYSNKEYPMEKKSSKNDAGKTGQQHAEEWNWSTSLHHTQK